MNHAKSGCIVTQRTFSCNCLTIRQGASSHHALMWQDALFKRSSIIGGRLCMTFLGTAPTTEHYKLGDWSTSLPVWKTWGLHRPPSTICSGAGRPVYQFGRPGTAPTTEHYKLGDWSTSLPVWRPGDCTDQSEHYMLGDWSTSLLV